jgi:hypothetical protein
MKAPSGNIFIYCDDPSHPTRRIAVTNFHPTGLGDGRWDEWYTSTAAQGTRESGTTLVDDEPPSPGAVHDPDAYRGRDVRSRYRLECRKCRARTAVAVREENLFLVLNTLAEHGVSQISLGGVAARLLRIST